jgi:hypothetical protein
MLLAAGLLVFEANAFAIDITRCGQEVADNQIGELQNDLTCPGLPGTCPNAPDIACTSPADCPPLLPGGFQLCSTDPVALGNRTTLNLNGHTLSGSPSGVFVPASSATIQGPGTITSPGETAVSFLGKKLRINDVEIRDSDFGIFTPFGGKVEATNLDIHDLSASAIFNSRSVKGTNVTLTRCGLAPVLPGENPLVQSVSRAAIQAKRVKIVGFTATDNGGPAFAGKSCKISNGVLSGNDADFLGYDLLTFGRPRLLNTTCSKSGKLGYGPRPPAGAPPLIVVGPSGVCTGD